MYSICISGICDLGVESRLSDLKIHSIIDKLNPNLRSVETFDGKKRVREFYAMSAEDAYSILEAIAEIHGYVNKLTRVKPSEAEEIAEETAQEIVEERKERIAPFSFFKCNIPIGAELVFFANSHDTSGITCTVIDDKYVEYQGQKYSLSALAAQLVGRGPLAGPRYFKYNGEWLNDVRHRLGV